MRAKGGSGGLAPPRETEDEEYCNFDMVAVDRGMDGVRDLAAARARRAGAADDIIVVEKRGGERERSMGGTSFHREGEIRTDKVARFPAVSPPREFSLCLSAEEEQQQHNMHRKRRTANNMKALTDHGTLIIFAN